MIDLSRLQVLRAIHHHETVTAAAHALHLTPSAVSQQIRGLSRDLGVALLEPTGRRVRLTPAAYTLLRHADTLASQWERAQAELAAHAEEVTGELRLCGFPTAIAGLLAPAAARLRDQYPHLTVHVTEIEPVEAFDLLLSGDADLAVVEATPESPPVSDTRFDQQPLLDDPMDLLVPTNHPFAAREAVSLAEAADQPWIVGAPSSAFHQLTLAACTAAGFAPDIVHTAKEWISMPALVAHGLGIALAPRLGYIPPDPPTVRVRLHGDPTPSRRILTCVRHGSRIQPPLSKALQILSELTTAWPNTRLGTPSVVSP